MHETSNRSNIAPNHKSIICLNDFYSLYSMRHPLSSLDSQFGNFTWWKIGGQLRRDQTFNRCRVFKADRSNSKKNLQRNRICFRISISVLIIHRPLSKVFISIISPVESGANGNCLFTSIVLRWRQKSQRLIPQNLDPKKSKYRTTRRCKWNMFL